MVLVYRILSKFAFQLSNSFQEIWTFAKHYSVILTEYGQLQYHIYILMKRFHSPCSHYNEPQNSDLF